MRFRQRQWEAVVKSFEILRNGSGLGTIGSYLKNNALAMGVSAALWFVLTLVIVWLEGKVELARAANGPEHRVP